MRRTLAHIMTLLSILTGTIHAQTTTPYRADDFVDYMGIGASFGNDFGRYDQLVYDGLNELGVRYIRGWMNWLNTGEIGVGQFRDLGVRMCGLWQDPKFKRPLECRPLLKQYGTDFFIAIEGHNEPDIFSKDQCFEGACNDTRNGIYNATILQHNVLYDDLKSDPETTGLPIVAPSFARTRQIGNAPGLKHDLRNLHYYPVWGEDSRPLAGYGWEGTTFDEVLENTADYGSENPIFFTESGNGLHQFSERAQAKYIGRMFAEYFTEVSAIDKFFYFRLHQQFNTGSGHEEWGLIDTLGNRYDAFYALKSVTDLLGEATYIKEQGEWILPNEDFQPQPVSLAYTNKLATTHELLLQKGNGRYFLLLWQEVNSYLFQSKEDVEPPVDELTIQIEEGIKNVRQYAYNQDFYFEHRTVQVKDSISVTVEVPDYLTVVAFDLASAPDVIASVGTSFNALAVYPNPTNGLVYLRGEIPVSSTEASITNLSGKTFKVQIRDKRIELMDLPDGVYFLKIPVNGQLITKYLILQSKK